MSALAKAPPRSLRVLVTHLKPPWGAQTERELERLRPPRVTIARDGERYRLLPG